MPDAGRQLRYECHLIQSCALVSNIRDKSAISADGTSPYADLTYLSFEGRFGTLTAGRNRHRKLLTLIAASLLAPPWSPVESGKLFTRQTYNSDSLYRIAVIVPNPKCKLKMYGSTLQDGKSNLLSGSSAWAMELCQTR